MAIAIGFLIGGYTWAAPNGTNLAFLVIPTYIRQGELAATDRSTVRQGRVWLEPPRPRPPTR